MADTSVKYFHSSMSGAPVLSGTAGALIALLDACLINGFGLGTLDSLVIAGGIATATRAGGHSQEVNSVVLIAGATVTGGVINGEQKVLSVTATTFTFATTLANQTATGTITAKLAPAAWTKAFSGTNLAAYKPTDVTATGCLMRVDDTGAKISRIVGYESMSDVNTGSGPFPTAAQISGGLYATKSNVADSSSRSWMFVADGKTFYFAHSYHSSFPLDYELSVFGDIVSVKSGDAFNCIVSAQIGDVTSQALNANNAQYYIASPNVTNGTYIARAYTGLGSSIGVSRSYPQPFYAVAAGLSGGPVNVTAGPNATDGGLYLVNHFISESSGTVYRGMSPGMCCVPQSVPAGTFATKDTISGVTGYAGRMFKALTGQSSIVMMCAFDITGPWR